MENEFMENSGYEAHFEKEIGSMGTVVKEYTFVDLDVEGNINVTGKVDGVDISEHAANVSIHHTHGNLANLNLVNQNVGTSGSPEFKGLTINGDIKVTGKVDGLDVSVHAADADVHHTHTNKANLDVINQNLGTANAPAFAGLTVNGNLTVTGSVDGVDVSAHAARHQVGGADALTGNLDANARVQVKANGTAIAARRSVNFIAGSNVTLTAADSAANETVNVTIAAAGGTTDPQVVKGVAGEALAAYDLCYLKADGKYWKAASGSVATMPGLVLASAAFTANQSGSFIRRGQVTNSKWAFATVGGFVYAGSTAGSLTQTIPSASGEQLQIVGIAKSATQIDFEPNLLLVEVA